ncbi:MAG TPA: ShlB/FhaC/HecB family hemolysin secretion/activation protein [Candidatus Eisenbacteria bacterium]|nr:ShlB/FhaC/HecB family hemolysin secretion/activation protein [Candidatus Eisenbacteria bacterium]
MKSARFCAALCLLSFLSTTACQAAPELAGDFFGIKMASETRAAHFSSDGFARGELGEGMDKRVYARADFQDGKITVELFNGLDIPLSVKDDYRALTILTGKRGDLFEYEMKDNSGKAELPPKKHTKLRMKGKFPGKKEDIKRIVLRFNLGDVKVVFVPAGPTSWASIVARASEAAPAAPPPPAAEPKREVVFQIHKVTFRGNKVIPTKELDAVAAPFLNSDVNLTVLQDLVSEIKKHYRSKGYPAAYAYLPEQKVSSGDLDVEIFEGNLGKVDVEGNKFVSDTAVKKYFGDLKPGRVLEYKALEGDLGRLNKNADVKAAAVLHAGAQPGTTDLKLNVQDKKPVHWSVDANNLGAPSTGRTRVGTTFTNNNLFGNTDSLTVRAQGGRDAGAVSVDYNAPVHVLDSRLGAGYTHAFNEVGSGDFRDLGIRGDVDVYSVYALHPFLLKPDFEVTGKLGFDWKSAENEILDTVSGKDELRELNAGITFQKNDASGTTVSPHTVLFGLDALGASTTSDPVTNAGADGSFLIYRESILRQQRLGYGLSLYLRETAQLASDALPPVEQLVLGGPYSVRGYSQSAFLGDSGISGTAEMHVPAFFFPRAWKMPFSGEPFNQAFEGVAFFDAGTAQKEDALVGDTESATFYGAGAGFRLHLFDRIYGRAEWAKPISEGRVNGDDQVISYFGISVELI